MSMLQASHAENDSSSKHNDNKPSSFSSKTWTFSPQVLVEEIRSKCQPYIKLSRTDNPMGAILCFWPLAWGGLIVAFHENIPLNRLLRIFPTLFLCAFLVHAAAATYNDICDRDLDAFVERSNKRPMALKQITLVQASVFLAAQILLLSYVVIRASNHRYLLHTIIPHMILEIIYPFTKRFCHFSALICGLAVASGIPMAAYCISENAPIIPILFATAACTAKVTCYDTVYGHMDKQSDVGACIKSVALKLGNKGSEALLALLFSLALVCMSLSGFTNQNTMIYHIIVLGGSCFQFMKAAMELDLDDPSKCLSAFLTISNAGLWIGLGVLADYLFKNLTSL